MSINRNIQFFRAQNTISKSTVFIPKKQIYAQRPTSGLPEVQNLGLQPLSVQMTPVCVFRWRGIGWAFFLSKVQSQEGAQAHHDPISSDSP